MAGRPREFDKEQTLDRAMHLFWERGFDATSVTDLTKELGIGRQSLYGTFGDKRSLFIDCLNRYMDEILKKTLIDELSQPGSPLANVRRVLDGWEDYAKSSTFRGCLLGKSMGELGMRDEALDAIMRRKIDRVERSFEAAFKRAKALGELTDKADPRVLARAITALSQGISVVCQVWRDPKIIRQTIDGMRVLLDASTKST